jgi:hypothetical protein
MEILLLLGLAGLGYYFLASGPGTATEAAKNGWRPVLNPTPLATEALDALAKIGVTNGATIRFGLVHDPFPGESASSYAIATGQLADVRITDDKQRLWKVKFQTAAAANVAPVSASDIKGSMTKDTAAQKSLPDVGAEFILTDSNIYL